MADLGDFVGSETVNCLFCTVQSTGAPTTLSGTPKLRCYKNGSTTESSDLTPTVDFDSRTGLNLVAIDLTGDSGFYSTGADYTIVITAGTVNSVSVVGYVVGTFSILHRSALRPTTAGRTLVVDASGLADANVVKVGPTGSGTAQTAGDLKATLTALFTTALTESYNADGAAPTVAQALFLIIAFLMEPNISSTTLTAKKLDGSTTAATFTLSDATNPVSVTRAT